MINYDDDQLLAKAMRYDLSANGNDHEAADRGLAEQFYLQYLGEHPKLPGYTKAAIYARLGELFATAINVEKGEERDLNKAREYFEKGLEVGENLINRDMLKCRSFLSELQADSSEERVKRRMDFYVYLKSIKADEYKKQYTQERTESGFGTGHVDQYCEMFMELIESLKCSTVANAVTSARNSEAVGENLEYISERIDEGSREAKEFNEMLTTSENIKLAEVSNDGIVKLQRGSFAVPVEADQERRKSSVYLRMDYCDFDMLYGEFAEREWEGEAERLFCEVVETIKEKDLEKGVEISYKRPEMSGEEKKEFEKSVAGWMRWHVFLDGSMEGYSAEKVYVYRKILAGRDVIFIWGFSESTGRGQKRWRFDFVRDDKTGRLCWNAERKDSGTYDLIRDMMQENCEPVEDAEFEQNVVLAGAGTEHEVRLQFRGKEYNHDVFGAEYDGDDEVMAFYDAAQKVFKAGEHEKFAGLYTRFSGKKYLRMREEDRIDRFNGWYDRQLERGKVVRYVMDAEPFYIVFTAGRKGGDATRWEYVVRDADSGELKLTNFYVETPFDDVLREPGLFEAEWKSDIEVKDVSGFGGSASRCGE
ncbi:hypothetical protein [Anaerohalosphaera lusitana]|uniref:hypothetical protein n=1 Tax=Anaerohalosphaera lusitana TaxID=1936003 RepID=UPI0011BA95AE|nr:hypothetical protein [Anaerohalosphaera lusitana]